MTEVSLEEVNRTVAAIAQSVEAFKQTNDERIAQAVKGRVDPLVDEKLARINADMDKFSDTLKALEKQATRPMRGAGDDAAAERQAKALDEFNLSMQFLAAQGSAGTKQFGSHEDLVKYSRDFAGYLRQGDKVHDLHNYVRQAFSVSVSGEGGFLVPPDMSGRIITKLRESSPMRQLANVRTTSLAEVQGIADTTDITTWWAGEREADTDSTNDPLGLYTIPVDEIRAQPKATLQILEDAAMDFEGWLAAKVASALARGETTAFFTGSGVKKPRGFLDYSNATTPDATRAWGTLQYVITGASGAFKTSDTPPAPADCLHDVVAALKPAYRANATWLQNRATLAAVKKLKDANGQYLWEPSLQLGQAQRLMGYPVAEGEDMPAIAANSLSIAFGDFREGYEIVDRLGITILRDPFTAKGYVRFFTRKRVGGRLVNSDAIKLLKFGTS